MLRRFNKDKGVVSLIISDSIIFDFILVNNDDYHYSNYLLFENNNNLNTDSNIITTNFIQVPQEQFISYSLIKISIREKNKKIDADKSDYICDGNNTKGNPYNYTNNTSVTNNDFDDNLFEELINSNIDYNFNSNNNSNTSLRNNINKTNNIKKLILNHFMDKRKEINDRIYETVHISTNEILKSKDNDLFLKDLYTIISINFISYIHNYIKHSSILGSLESISEYQFPLKLNYPKPKDLLRTDYFSLIENAGNSFININFDFNNVSLKKICDSNENNANLNYNVLSQNNSNYIYNSLMKEYYNKKSELLYSNSGRNCDSNRDSNNIFISYIPAFKVFINNTISCLNPLIILPREITVNVFELINNNFSLLLLLEKTSKDMILMKNLLLERCLNSNLYDDDITKLYTNNFCNKSADKNISMINDLLNRINIAESIDNNFNCKNNNQTRFFKYSLKNNDYEKSIYLDILLLNNSNNNRDMNNTDENSLFNFVINNYSGKIDIIDFTGLMKREDYLDIIKLINKDFYKNHVNSNSSIDNPANINKYCSSLEPLNYSVSQSIIIRIEKILLHYYIIRYTKKANLKLLAIKYNNKSNYNGDDSKISTIDLQFILNKSNNKTSLNNYNNINYYKNNKGSISCFLILNISINVANNQLNNNVNSKNNHNLSSNYPSLYNKIINMSMESLCYSSSSLYSKVIVFDFIKQYPNLVNEINSRIYDNKYNSNSLVNLLFILNNFIHYNEYLIRLVEELVGININNFNILNKNDSDITEETKNTSNKYINNDFIQDNLSYKAIVHPYSRNNNDLNRSAYNLNSLAVLKSSNDQLTITDFSFLTQKIENSFEKDFKTYTLTSYKDFIHLNTKKIKLLNNFNNSNNTPHSLLSQFYKVYKKLSIQIFNNISFELFLDINLLHELAGLSPESEKEFNNNNNKLNISEMLFRKKMIIEGNLINNDLIIEFFPETNSLKFTSINLKIQYKLKDSLFYIRKFMEEVLSQYTLFLLSLLNQFNLDILKTKILYNKLSHIDLESLNISPIGVYFKVRDYGYYKDNLDNSNNINTNINGKENGNISLSSSSSIKTISVQFSGIEKKNNKKTTLIKVILIPLTTANQINETYLKYLDLIINDDDEGIDTMGKEILFIDKLAIFIKFSYIYDICKKIFGDYYTPSNNYLEYINNKAYSVVKLELLKKKFLLKNKEESFIRRASNGSILNNSNNSNFNGSIANIDALENNKRSYLMEVDDVTNNETPIENISNSNISNNNSTLVSSYIKEKAFLFKYLEAKIIHTKPTTILITDRPSIQLIKLNSFSINIEVLVNNRIVVSLFDFRKNYNLNIGNANNSNIAVNMFFNAISKTEFNLYSDITLRNNDNLISLISKYFSYNYEKDIFEIESSFDYKDSDNKNNINAKKAFDTNLSESLNEIDYFEKSNSLDLVEGREIIESTINNSSNNNNNSNSRISQNLSIDSKSKPCNYSINEDLNKLQRFLLELNEI